MPWNDQDGKSYGPHDQVRGRDGTLYPSNWDKAAIPGLTWEDAPAPPPPTKDQQRGAVDYQIERLEAKQARPIREATLGKPGATARLQAIEDQIATLRAERAAL
jgi:hypothetical protein